MGQSYSSSAAHPTPTRRESTRTSRAAARSATAVHQLRKLSSESVAADSAGMFDYISDLPDECIGFIFHFLGSKDRKHCSLVCRRWLAVEGQHHHCLSLTARADILAAVPVLLRRFDSVTKLALRCDRRSVSLSDEALVQISLRCPNLTRLKIRGCRELTDVGVAAFAENCRGLRKLSCGSCTFGSRALNAVLDHCFSLEELSVKRLRGINDGAASDPIGPGAAAASLKVVCLKELYNGQCFGPLLIGAKNLRTLKLFRCLGDWDKLLQMIGSGNPNLVEIHLERLQLSDKGLSGMSNCSNLEILHLVKTPECTSSGLASLADHCRLLRKLHVDGWRTNRIGDEGLVAVAKKCPNLQELVLIGVNPTSLSLAELASNCQNLERLALCGSDTIGDAEILCIAEKCNALRKLCIKGCPISDHGLQVLAWGCPNLVKVKVKKCREVTGEIAEWLKLNRGSLIVNLDSGEIEQLDANTSDSGAAVEDGPYFPPLTTQIPANAPSSRNGRLTMFKSKFGQFAVFTGVD